MNKLLLVAGAVVLGPSILRALAGRPELLRSGADLLERTRDTAVDLGKRGARYGKQAAERIAKEIEARRAAKMGVAGCSALLAGLASAPDPRVAWSTFESKCLSREER